MKQFTHHDDRDYSATPRHRQFLDKGCFRFVPDNINNQREDWREVLYSDDRPINLRRAKQRR